MFMLFKKRGISLLEVMLSLAIIAIILVMATRYFTITRRAQQINDSVTMVETIKVASTRWLMGHTDFTDMTIPALNNLNLLPEHFDKTPWGTDLTVGSDEDASQFKITFDSIPLTACQVFEAKITAIKNTCDPISGSTLVNYVGTFSH